MLPSRIYSRWLLPIPCGIYSPLLPCSVARLWKALAFFLLVIFGLISLSGFVWNLGNHWLSFNPWRENHKTKNDKLAPPSDELSDFHIYNSTKTWPRPHLHVLVDARRHHDDPVNLCRTLLSAVVQGYPPPILIGYRPDEWGGDNSEGSKNDPVSLTESFLSAALNAIRYTKIPQSEQKQENVVLFLGQGQWIQMPAEVTARRYLQHMEIISQRLTRKYGLASLSTPNSSSGINFTQERQHQTQQTYRLGVLFPGSRRKSRLKSQRRGNETRQEDNTEKKEQEMDESLKSAGSHGNSSVQDQDDIIPESSLPEDVYGVFPDAGKERTRWWRKEGYDDKTMSIPTRYQRPRYLGGGSFMGEVGDVERLLKGAVERVGWLDDEEYEESVNNAGEELTYLFSEMFFEQEIERRRVLRRQADEIIKQGGRKVRWYGLRGLMGGEGPANEINEEESLNPDEYEFSIGLDYENRIFQDMAEYQDSFNTTTTPITSDIRFLTFTRPNLVKSPSTTAAHLYRAPLRLPPELIHPFSPGGRSSPFGLAATRYNLSEVLKVATQAVGEEVPREGEGESTKMTMMSWADLEFATNVVVPRGSVPSVLDMAGVDSEAQAGEKVDSERDKYWRRMWFKHKQEHRDGDDNKEQGYTPLKGLLDEYLHPNRYIYALEAADGGKNWWNLRGGRGGFWTDQGGWIPWSQICGEFDLD